MLRAQRHADLVQENLEDALLLRAFVRGLVDAVVHDLDGHALVGGQVDGQFDPEWWEGYCENRPKPSLKRTRYFSSMIGHSSMYSLGSSRRQFI